MELTKLHRIRLKAGDIRCKRNLLFSTHSQHTDDSIYEKSRCAYINDARSFNWIFLRLFIYVMVVSATVRYGTSMSHISLPQTSVSVDSWVAKKKSKNYHN